MTSRRPSLRMMWSSRRRMFHARRMALPGNTARHCRPHPHFLRDASSSASDGSVANAAPLSAPADVPMMTSGTMPRSSSGAQHPDLAHALVAAAREHEGRRGFRVLPVPGRPSHLRQGSSLPRSVPHDLSALVFRPSVTSRYRRSCGIPLPEIVARGTTPSAHRFSPFGRFVGARAAVHRLRPQPHRGASGGPRVTDFYRQYLAVAVLIGAAMLMVGAMLGRRPAPPARPAPGREVHLLRGRLRPDRRLRTVERPLLRLRPALRHVRRRGRVHLPVGRPASTRSVCSGSSRCWSSSSLLTLGLVYAWRKGVLRWA